MTWARCSAWLGGARAGPQRERWASCTCSTLLKPQTEHDDPDLLDDVESFVGDIAKGGYAEGYGFDSDYGEYRTFGDESWTVEMDDLLDRVGAVFLAGAVTLARGAYRMLLEAIGRDDAESGLPGAGTPEELIGGDVGEAKARYLRSIWESEPLTNTRGCAGRRR